MLSRLLDFQRNNFLCDAIIVSKSLAEYKVHSVIMAAVSQVFEEAFKSSPSYGIRYINLPSVDDETILAFINSVYSGKIILPKLLHGQRLEEMKNRLKLLGIDENSFNYKNNCDHTDENLVLDYFCKICQMNFDSHSSLTYHDCQKSNILSQNISDTNFMASKLRYKLRNDKKIVSIKATPVKSISNIGSITIAENQPLNLTNTSTLSFVSAEISGSEDILLPLDSVDNLYTSKENIVSSEMDCIDEKYNLKSSIRNLTFSKRPTSNNYNSLRNGKRKISWTKYSQVKNYKKRKINISKIQDNDQIIIAKDDYDDLVSQKNFSPMENHSNNAISELSSEFDNFNSEKSFDHDHIVNKISRRIKDTSYKLKYLSVHREGFEDPGFEWSDKFIELDDQKSGKQMVICELCGLGLRKYSIRSHMETMHQRNNSKYPCDECDQVFHTGHRRHMHSIREHKKDPQGHLCELCGRRFDNSTSIYYHMYKHRKEKEEVVIKKMARAEMKVKKEVIQKKKKKGSLQCQHCQQIFSKSSLLRQHINKVHTDVVKKIDLPFKCDYCDKEFDYKSQYQTHVTIHKEDRTFVCPHCGKGFKNRVGIHYHLRIHSSVKRFICKECGQGFKLSHHLKQHMTHHTTLRPFKCDICEKAYKAKSDLKNHLKQCHRIDSSKNCVEISRELRLLDYITEQDMMNEQNILSNF